MLVVFKHIGPLVYEHLELGGEYNPEAYEALLDSAFDECVEYQTFFNTRWTYGRKPPTEGENGSALLSPTSRKKKKDVQV